MRCMTVWKSCHGVCNLEACFSGAISMVGGNYARCPPKLVEISCLFHQNWNFDLPHTANAQSRRRQIRLMAAASHTFKKTRPPNAASSVLVHDEVGLDRPSVRHVLVCLIDFIQRIAVREDLARIDLTVKDRLQQDFLVIGRH